MISNRKLKYKIFGKKHGDFSPKNQSREQFLAQIEKSKRTLGGSVAAIFAPRAEFTNRVAKLGENDNIFAPWLIRTKDGADAGIVERPGIAVAFFPGDCPTLCLHEGQKLLAAHLGYRAIIRENVDEKGIIENAAKYFNPRTAKAFIFGGIGPCCWVPEEDKTEIQNSEKCRHPKILAECLSRTTRSPLGKNLVSVDLYKLSRLLLLKTGFLPHNITLKPLCTCCSCVQENGEPAFWSHTRFMAEGGIDGRNFSAVWVE